eukprot:6186645-Pleurochrysis_carterae.AAC.3
MSCKTSRTCQMKFQHKLSSVALSPSARFEKCSSLPFRTSADQRELPTTHFAKCVFLQCALGSATRLALTTYLARALETPPNTYLDTSRLYAYCACKSRFASGVRRVGRRVARRGHVPDRRLAASVGLHLRCVEPKGRARQTVEASYTLMCASSSYSSSSTSSSPKAKASKETEGGALEPPAKSDAVESSAPAESAQKPAMKASASRSPQASPAR